MFPRNRAIQALQPAVRPTRILALKPRPSQVQPRRAFAEKAAPVRPDQPRDWTSRLPLFILAGIGAYLPFYYFAHASKPFASGQQEKQAARRQGDPSKEFRDPRDTSVKTLEQKLARDGVDLRSESKK